MNSSTTVRRPALLALSLLAAGALAGCATPAGQQSAGEGSAAAGSTTVAAGSAAPSTGGAGATSAPAGTSTAGTSVPDRTTMATDPPPPSTTEVVLNYATYDAARGVLGGGYVSPVIEDGGTCTLVLTKGSATVQATSEGRADASTTACGGLTVPRDQLTAGTWTAVLRYASGTAKGHSATLSVQVPA